MSESLFEKMLETQQKMLQESLNTWQKFWSFPTSSEPVSMGSTPCEVVFEEGTLRLLHYRPEVDNRRREPVLVCYSLVNRPYILDLQADRSVIRQLLRAGLDVYLIDWGVPRDEDASLRLQDYVGKLLKNVTEFVLQRTDSPTLNLFGYCMGGTMATLYAALYPEQIHTLTLLATPIDFSGEEGLLNVWTQEKYFDVDRLIDTHGNCPASLLQTAFQMMKPVQNFIEKFTRFYENQHDEKFLENFFSMEQWLQDNVPVAGETFREFIKCFYQRNQLIKGIYNLGDQPIFLNRIRCPVLLLTAEFDHLVPASSTLGLEPHIGSREVGKMSIPVGHIGLAVSSRAHGQFWPEAVEWIANHCNARL